MTSVIRATSANALMLGGSAAIHTVQLLALPLAAVSNRLFTRTIDATQVAFAELLLLVHVACTPAASIEVTADAGVFTEAQWAALAGESPSAADADALIADLGARAVLLSNHQTLFDWMFLWFVAYRVDRAAALKIILKESPKYIPILGPGMMFFKFIFLKRDWSRDQHALHAAMRRLRGEPAADPKWLLVFPEGTILTENTLGKTRTFAAAAGLPAPAATLVPRTTGIHAIMRDLLTADNELPGKPFDRVLDVTLGYTPAPGGKLPGNAYHPIDIYVRGNAPKTVYFHFSAANDFPAFPSSSVDPAVAAAHRASFDAWVLARFAAKEQRVLRLWETGKWISGDAKDGAAAAKEGERRVTIPISFNAGSRLLLPWNLLGCVTVAGAAWTGIYFADWAGIAATISQTASSLW
ncbi:hypothetical protein H9P43_004635 [Blastocladiella emersonii ATCC 22665]|nr:hypothetical protein H9P43_004635 [Blastocladiella emersonii ATCC 22665]